MPPEHVAHVRSYLPVSNGDIAGQSEQLLLEVEAIFVPQAGQLKAVVDNHIVFGDALIETNVLDPLAGASPRFPALRVVDVVDLFRGRNLTILAELQTVAAFAHLLVPRHRSVQHIHSHVIEAALVQFNRRAGPYFVVKVGHEALHRRRTDKRSVPL